MPVCADCGAVIELVPWAEKIGAPKWAKRRGDGHVEMPFRSSICRESIDWSDPNNPRVVACDYHHVEGEEQRRWRLST